MTQEVKPAMVSLPEQRTSIQNVTDPTGQDASSIAKPRTRKRAVADTSPHTPSIPAIAAAIVSSLEDDKAEDVLSINLTGKSSLADFMIVASGRSQRHVGALADHVHRKLKEIGVGQVRIEGLPSADWVLVDTGDVIVHIFRPEVRAYYGLEKLWASDARPASAGPPA
jgi:ribosome-associated protein